MTGRLLLVGCAITLCAIAAPAMAGLFDFHIGSLNSTFNSTTGAFTASPILTPYETTVNVVRHQAPTGAALLFGPGLAAWGGNFSISMNIGNIVTDLLDPSNDSADGNGTFTLTDVTGDVLAGTLAGTWVRTGSANTFAGTMSNVTFSGTDNAFDGNWVIVSMVPLIIAPTSVSMLFSSSQPWAGTLTELSTAGPWFGESSYTTSDGSVDASVLPVPVPGAVLLGFLGLSVAGVTLRKYV